MEENNQGQQPQNMEPKNSGSKTGVIVAVIVILALLGWYFMPKKNSGVKSVSENGSMMVKENVSAQPMSLKDLMSGSSQKCTVSYPVGKDGTSEGTIFVASGKMRGDFNTTVMGKAEAMHMINDGKMQYMWTEGDHSMAMKMSVEAMMQAKPQDSQNAQRPQGIDQNAKYNYNCSGWSKDDSQFTPPSNITFSDYTEMMSKAQNPAAGASAGTGAAGGPNVKAMQCNACNSLSGQEQAQCKAALSCP